MLQYTKLQYTKYTYHYHLIHHRLLYLIFTVTQSSRYFYHHLINENTKEEMFNSLVFKVMEPKKEENKIQTYSCLTLKLFF